MNLFIDVAAIKKDATFVNVRKSSGESSTSKFERQKYEWGRAARSKNERSKICLVKMTLDRN